VCIAISCLHLNHVVTDFKHGDVKGTTTKVVYDNLLILLFIESVGERGGGWLVDDTLDLKSSNLARVLSGLTL